MQIVGTEASPKTFAGINVSTAPPLAINIPFTPPFGEFEILYYDTSLRIVRLWPSPPVATNHQPFHAFVHITLTNVALIFRTGQGYLGVNLRVDTSVGGANF